MCFTELVLTGLILRQSLLVSKGNRDVIAAKSGDAGADEGVDPNRKVKKAAMTTAASHSAS